MKIGELLRHFLKKIKNKMNFYVHNFALLQSRLVNIENKKEIQFFPKSNWKRELSHFKKNKIRFIEWAVCNENLKFNPIFYEKKLSLIKKICKKNKVRIRSVDAQFFVQRPIYIGNTLEKKENYNNLKQVFLNAQILNIKYFIIPALENATLDSSYKIKRLFYFIKKLLRNLKKGNFILIESDLRPKKFKLLIKKFNSKRVGINYDTGNSAGNGYNFNEEKDYFEYVKNIHIKDKKFRGSSVRLGKGDFNFKDFFIFLKTIEYKGDFAFQTARSKSNKHLREFRLNLKYIKKYV